MYYYLFCDYTIHLYKHNDVSRSLLIPYIHFRVLWNVSHLYGKYLRKYWSPFCCVFLQIIRVKVLKFSIIWNSVGSLVSWWSLCYGSVCLRRCFSRYEYSVSPIPAVKAADSGSDALHLTSLRHILSLFLYICRYY